MHLYLLVSLYYFFCLLSHKLPQLSHTNHSQNFATSFSNYFIIFFPNHFTIFPNNLKNTVVTDTTTEKSFTKKRFEYNIYFL